MTRTLHTQGPWEPIKGSIPDDDLRCAVVVIREDVAYLVATIENGAPGDICATEYANAKLIAAAPDMLEALQNIENDNAHMPPSAWKMIQNAITKATGK